MFYKKLNINGTEYPLAVNITGNGVPTENTEATVGMFYMDEGNRDVYKKTANGWERLGAPTLYNFTGTNGGIEITYNYGNETATMLLEKNGGNGLFDFRKLTGSVSGTIFYATGDWHSPFKMSAVNNADGDNVESHYFTGGNHRTTNQGSGGATTARTSSIRYFADGKEITGGKGVANEIEIRWTNMVQGYNTSKADGTGREILQENHVLKFRNGVFYTDVELVALEDINLETYYGFCGFVGENYTTTKYLGATNRLEYPASSNSKSGDITAYKMTHYGTNHRMTLELDPSYDWGGGRSERCWSAGGMFVSSGKCYFAIVEKGATMSSGCTYCIRGKYTFEPV